ncbi:PilZ domain-containing protein [Sphingobium sp. YR657]|uniref:PilZ domain-containing protein n=1 Tax=Sphingobium sp. YR657 TaxID=1884366 RepID=UPI001587E7B1|nr:PilZ domain-containing protein [Sphingobium sp. YR657]
MSLGTILRPIGLLLGTDRIEMMLNALACTSERRHSPRESVEIHCTVNWAGLYEFATIKNMSIYGAQLEGFEFPPVGTPVTIVVDQVELCASIIWADGEKCGVLLEHDVDPAVFIRQHSIRPLGHGVKPIGTISQLRPLDGC